MAHAPPWAFRIYAGCHSEARHMVILMEANLWTGASLSELFCLSHFETVGAPSLRFLQGRVRWRLYHEIFGEVKIGSG